MSSSFTPQPPYRHVVVGTDGSQLSGTALLGGSILAGMTSAQLHVFHASMGDDTESAVVEQASDLLRDRPFKLVTRNLGPADATPAEMIAGFAAELNGEAIVVIGTHGRGSLGVSVLGSTAVELVSGANRPILAYGPEARSPISVDRVVACVDGSRFSELSVVEGARWAAALSVPLWLIQVVSPDFASAPDAIETNYVHNIGKDLRGLSSPIEWDVLHAESPARSILEWQGDTAATMLVMATHGRVGLQRALMGSVSSEVVKKTGGPVVLVRPPVS